MIIVREVEGWSDLAPPKINVRKGPCRCCFEAAGAAGRPSWGLPGVLGIRGWLTAAGAIYFSASFGRQT